MKESINRREMLAVLGATIQMPHVKDCDTLKQQIQIIKSLWNVTQKLDILMFAYIPHGYRIDEDTWSEYLKLQITGMNDEFAIFIWSEVALEPSYTIDFIEYNKIMFNKLPEVINIGGNCCAACEMFRLDISKYKKNI